MIGTSRAQTSMFFFLSSSCYFSSRAEQSTADHSRAQQSRVEHSTSTAQQSTEQHNTAQHSTAQHVWTSSSTCMHQSYNFLRASRSIAKTGLFFGSNGGSENEVEKVLKKWFQRVPKWTPKVGKNRQKGCFGGVPKRNLKKVPSPGP